IPVRAITEGGSPAAPTAFYHCILDRDEIVWAGDCAAVVGFAPAAMPRTATVWEARVHPDDRAARATALAACLAGGGVVRLGYRVQDPDGDYRPLQEEVASPVGGVLLGTVRADDASCDPLRFFALGLDLFCVTSLDGVFALVNPHFATLLGYLEKALLGRSF